MITVQPPLSEPLWPAPKSTSLDNRESIFDVQLTTPTPISHIYHRLTVFYPILAWEWQLTHALHNLLEHHFSTPNCRSHEHSKRWLHCSLLCMCISISYPIFVLWLALFAWLKVRIIEGLDNRGSDNQGWTVLAGTYSDQTLHLNSVSES